MARIEPEGAEQPGRSWIYRVHYNDSADGSQGFGYFSALREAEKALREWRRDAPETRGPEAADIDKRPAPRTKGEVLDMLHQWATHADNGPS